MFLSLSGAFIKGVAVLGLLWSIYACYKILSFNLNSDLPAEKLINKEETEAPQVEIVSKKHLKYFRAIKTRPTILIENPTLL